MWKLDSFVLLGDKWLMNKTQKVNLVFPAVSSQLELIVKLSAVFVLQAFSKIREILIV